MHETGGPDHTDPRHDVANLPLDPDVEADDRARPHERVLAVLAERSDVLLVIAVGGALGSLGRYAVAEALPHPAGGFAWSTLTVNLTGAFALGVLMALLPVRWPDSRLVRPFFGVGLLGGWTTFSTAMLDLHAALDAGRVGVAAGYLAATLALGLPLALLGLAAGRVALSGRPRPGVEQPRGAGGER